MAGLFSTDSKLYRFMCRLTDLVKLNFLWLVFSLPIVTIGISTIAAHYVALKIAEGQEGYIFHDFIKAFKANWKQGIPMSFISLICIWALYLDFQLIANSEEHPVLFLITGIVAAYIFVFTMLYAFALLARYENTLLNTLRNGFNISMRYFLRSALLVIIVAIELAAMLWSPKTMILILICGPAFVMLTVCSVAINIFRDIESKNPESVERDEPSVQETGNE
ncbi:MAG: YesL family protein [Oscillospiraceae bacterium]|nr:YesL family protein [Oscillospiraceae bacterium]